MNHLILGDAFEELKKLIAQGTKCDLILVDPPYGTTSLSWDSPLHLEEMWSLVKQIRKENTACLFFGSEPFSSSLRFSNIKEYRYDLYWVKEKPTNFFQLKKRFGKLTENIIVFYKKQPVYNPQKYTVDHRVKNSSKTSHNSIVSGINKKPILPYNDDGTRYPNDILVFNREPLGSTVHPTQKPVLLLEYLIKTFSNENDLVIDFTMGSGTTGVACKNLNRKFIGIEKDEKYFIHAKERNSSDLT